MEIPLNLALSLDISSSRTDTPPQWDQIQIVSPGKVKPVELWRANEPSSEGDEVNSSAEGVIKGPDTDTDTAGEDACGPGSTYGAADDSRVKE